MSELFIVQWTNMWNEAAAAHRDVGTLAHLAEGNALTGTTLCGKTYPARKGYPSGLTRYCKRCMNKAHAAGQPRGFQSNLGFVRSVDD